MKTLKLTLIFVFVLFTSSSKLYSQNDVLWSGDGTDNYITNLINWGSVSVISPNDTLVFNTGGSIYVTIPFSISYNAMRIENNTSVYFESLAEDSITFQTIKIRNGSSLNIVQTGFELNTICNQAYIDGNITLDSFSHEFEALSSISQLIFRANSSFVAGPGLLSFPFSDQNPGTVIFEDGSNYYHYGGNSPFGGTDINVVIFNPGSNYYIEDGDGSNIYFSGKTYGNIINESGNDILAVGSSSAQPFSFYNMTALNGGIQFDGISSDEISVEGDSISASGGQITLGCGSNGIHFNGSNTYLKGSTNLKFNIDGAGTTAFFDILAPGHRLNIGTGVEFSSKDGVTHEVSVSGTLDTKDQTISFSNVNFWLTNTAELITAHPHGFQGCLPGAQFETLTNFEFNGSVLQNTGFTNGNIHPHLLAANNISSGGLKMDTDLNIDSLLLLNGDFNIDTCKLTVFNNIEPTNGKLKGLLSNSVLEIYDVPTGTIPINTPLELDSLIINSLNAQTLLTGNSTLNVNKLFINNGTLYLQGAELIVQDSYNRTVGSGILQGGPDAKLVFNNLSFSPSSLNAIELYKFINNSNYVVNMDGDLIIDNLLDMQNGTLKINAHTLTLNGDCNAGSGYIGGTENSNILVSGTNAATNNIYLNFDINADTLNSLTVNRTSNDIVNIGSGLFVKNKVDLTHGKIKLSDYNYLSFDPGATIINASQDDYIITQAYAFVQKDLTAGTSFLFPVGTESYYAPVTINPNLSVEYSINVRDTVYSEGDYGTPIENNNVNLRWEINTSDNYELTLTWPDAAQFTGFNPTQSYISHFNETDWDNPGLSVAATASGYNSQTRTILNLSGYFAVFSKANHAPVLNSTAEFTIPEHSPNGTVVGKIDVTDPDGDNILFTPETGTVSADAFSLEADGTIIVKNSDLLEYSINPSFTNTINVCDDGNPIQCITVTANVNLEEVIVDLEPANFISPNGDGHNDRWIVKGIEQDTFEAFIFNGNGKLLFRSDDYQNTWDGKSGGKDLPPGVYYYLLKSSNTERKGTVTLVR